jgi:tetratricopeptide (TPR) repeat protein
VLDSLLARLGPEDVPARSAALDALGGVAYWQRDLPASKAAYAEAVRLAEQTGDTATLAEAVFNLAFAEWQLGRMEEGVRLADRSQGLYADLGDADGVARGLWLHGVLAFVSGDLDGAERLLEQAVDRQRERPDGFHLGWSLRMLGRTLLLQGRSGPARGLLEESLRMFAPVGDVSAIVLHLADFATLAALEQDIERELRLAGAERQLQRLTGTDQADHPANQVPRLAETLAEYGPDADRLLAEGAAMSVDEAVRYALREP